MEAVSPQSKAQVTSMAVAPSTVLTWASCSRRGDQCGDCETLVRTARQIMIPCGHFIQVSKVGIARRTPTGALRRNHKQLPYQVPSPTSVCFQISIFRDSRCIAKKRFRPSAAQMQTVKLWFGMPTWRSAQSEPSNAGYSIRNLWTCHLGDRIWREIYEAFFLESLWILPLMD